MKPEAAIISVGSNTYGHPTGPVLSRLYLAGSDVLQTGCGANPCGKVMGHVVIVVKKGKKYWINGSVRRKDEFIKKTNRAPQADFTFSVKGNTVSFDASSCSDDGKIKHCFWNFGDGTTVSSRKLCKVSHTYDGEGDYTTFLSVLDKFGVSGVVTKKLFFGEVESVKASAYASPSDPEPNSHVEIHVTVKDQGGKPVSGASIKTIAHYKTTDTTKYGTSGSDGKNMIDYYISNATVGYTVVVSITASYGGLSAYTSTSFTPGN